MNLPTTEAHAMPPHEDLSCRHIGTMPPRAYYIPFENATRAIAHTYAREESSRFASLCGDWTFSWFPRYEDIPDNFVQKVRPLLGEHTLPVPSCWQTYGTLYGYDLPAYVNDNYPFPYDPPYLPRENPVGIYERDFMLDEDWDGLRKYIVFEGVDSCVYLYVNGRFVGYSNVSHMTAEFDITSFLSLGQNRVAAVVVKWNPGSYLECQDKWRMSGIFREVYLLARPSGHLQDVTIRTKPSPELRTADIFGSIEIVNPEDALLTLYHPDGAVVGRSRPDMDGNFSFTIEQPLLWSAETPDLYTLLIEAAGEAIAIHTGVREVTIDGSVFKINGRNIKFKEIGRAHV